MNPVSYIDSNYAGYKDTYCSTKGNIFIVAGGLVLWKSKQQNTTVLLTIEVEYIAFTKVMTQALWLTKFFDEVGLLIKTPIEI